MADDDELAEAGEQHEINGHLYSKVGDTVFRQGVFGSWSRVENDDEEAEAGDLREVDGHEYSNLLNKPGGAITEPPTKD